MADNPIETAANELKKWLELLEKYLNKMESEKAADKASKLTTERHDEMMKELKGIKEGLKKGPDGPEKDAVAKKVEGAEKKLADVSPDKKELKQGEAKKIKGPKAKAEDPAAKVDSPGKQSTGEALGWSKGKKGWQNQEGLSVKELGSKVKMPSPGGLKA